VKCLAALVNLEREWVPKKEGYSLYIRPTMISTTSTLGVAAASDAKMVRSFFFHNSFSLSF
jgi:branched-chain amino acid aminotransferase